MKRYKHTTKYNVPANNSGGCRLKRLYATVLLCGALWFCGCEFYYPEVIVVNDFGDRYQVKQIKFNGCVWEDVLEAGQQSIAQQCPPGTDRVRYQLLDVKRADGIWRNRRTVKVYTADYGDRLKVFLRQDNDEKDTDAPGPYGH